MSVNGDRLQDEYLAKRYQLDDTPAEQLPAANKRLRELGAQLTALGRRDLVLPTHRPRLPDQRRKAEKQIR